MVTTLGIDLASQHTNTASCTVEWSDGGARITDLQRGGHELKDGPLRAAIRAGHVKVAIDAPFGWPREFVAALSAHEDFGSWPAGDMTHRATDRFVHEQVRKLPLSVSTDKIAFCAMRCARLLDGLDEPRDGSGLVVEAYPDAALRRWLPDSFLDKRAPSYKGEPGSKRRSTLVDAVFAALGPAFSGDEWRDDCVESDDAFDALLCALIARAAERGKTVLPTGEQARLADLEGWIHLPEPGSLSKLIG